jgi:hypothetical protein
MQRHSIHLGSRRGCLVAISRDDDAFWRKHGRQLQPHVQALTSWEMIRMFTTSLPMKVTCVLVKCWWLLYGMRDDAKLFVLLDNLLAHLGLDRRKVEERWLSVYSPSQTPSGNSFMSADQGQEGSPRRPLFYLLHSTLISIASSNHHE